MKTLRTLLLALTSTLALLGASSLRAQAPGSVDATYDPNATGDYVLATAVQPDGKTIIGGLFTQVGGVARNNIARLNADGSLDTGFNPDANDLVYSVAVQGDGKILLGGRFSTLQPNGAASATPRNRIARLNSDGSLDPGFDPNANGFVYNVAVQADGKVLLGGFFSTLQPNGAASATPRNRIARLNSDGSLDPGFDPSANNTVVSVAEQADGKILLGGDFTTLQPNGGASATPRNRIARLNSDGSLDPGFDPNANGEVLSVAEQADGKILLSGDFTTLQPNGAASGATPRNRIARLNSDGSLDSGFDPNANGEVDSVAEQADGKILLSGVFGTLQPNGAASATPRNRIARLNSDGSLDPGFDPKANGAVYSVAVQADGKILLGGTFTTLQPNGAASPTTRNHFARLNNDNASQSLSAPDASKAQWLRGGSAPEVEQVTFELSTDSGANWTPLGSGTRIAGGWELSGLSLPASGSLRARGRTTSSYLNGGSGLIQQVDHFGPAGSVGAIYNPDVAGSYVLATAVQPDGKTIIGGLFTSVGAVARNRIARLNSDGSLDTGFNPKANSDVYSVAVQADGKILLGGVFTALQPNGAASATPRNRIARLNSDGSLDTGFDPNANSAVYSVAVQADGKILLGGEFTALQPNGAASATTRNFIARLNSDGSLDPGFDPNANNSVYSVAVQADGKILLGGNFSTLQPNGAASATTRNYLARLNSDGSLDPGFDPNANSDVDSVAVQADGKILLSGNFSTLQPNGAAGATPRNRIARLNSDGSLDPGFDPNPNGDVLSVAVQADGKILLGGDFSTLQPNGAASATTRNRIARLKSDGSLDPGFDPNVNSVDSVVYSVAVQTDGKILLGGSFSNVGGTARNLIARLNNDNASQSLSAPDTSKARWLRGGAAPEVEQVTFELSTSGPWTLLGSGTRIAGGWELSGLSLPASGSLRARGRTTNGTQNGGSGLVEQVQSFAGLAPPNSAPTITAATGLSRQQGSAASNATIAAVNDTESGAGAVTVTATSANPSNGITLSNIVNTAGTITADIMADCTATNATFTLQASDGSLTTDTTLNIGAIANTPPILTYNTTSVANGGSTTIGPATGPSDNGSVASIVVQSKGTYTGMISVNGAGLVSISNAAPAGSHTITIRATDNCGLTRDATFSLEVGAAPTPTPSPTATPTPTPAQALNISTRLRVDIGDKVMIGGFIIRGNASKPVVVRGLGPSLVDANVPAANVLNNPMVELRGPDGALILSNDDWKNSPQKSQIEGTVFEPTDDREAVILATLAPGNYTAILSGVGQTTGVGIVEVYDNNQALDSDLANISTRGFVQDADEVMIGGFILGNNPTNTRIAIRGLGPSLVSSGLSNLLADPTLELHNVNGTVMVSNDDWESDPVSAAQLSANGLALTDPREAGIFMSPAPPGQFTAIVAGKNGGIGIALIEIYNLR